MMGSENKSYNATIERLARLYNQLIFFACATLRLFKLKFSYVFGNWVRQIRAGKGIGVYHLGNLQRRNLHFDMASSSKETATVTKQSKNPYISLKAYPRIHGRVWLSPSLSLMFGPKQMMACHKTRSRVRKNVRGNKKQVLIKTV